MENQEDIIKDLELKLTLASKGIGLDELDRILHTDFLEFSSSGEILSKSDYFIKNGPSLKNLEIISFNIEFLQEDVALTKFKVQGKLTGKFSLRSSIWKFEDGRWQIVFHQGTIIKNSLLSLKE